MRPAFVCGFAALPYAGRGSSSVRTAALPGAQTKEPATSGRLWL